GAAQLLRGAVSDPELVRCTDIIVHEVERLDGLVEQLRELSTPPRLRLEAVNIHRVLNDVVALQRQSPAWGAVALRTAFDPSLPPVRGDRAQLTQVFLNLVKHALDAPGGTGAPPLADDEESRRWVRDGACTQHGHSVVAVASGTAALDQLRRRPFDVALVDIRMPDLSGLDVLKQAREAHIDTLFIIVTAQNTMANAIEATKRGAYDYLTKPFDLDQVELLVGRAMELRRLTRDLERLRGELEQRNELVIGRTPAMPEVYKVIGRVAPTDATVLIQGETGTGKELLAKTIHHHSERQIG